MAKPARMAASLFPSAGEGEVGAGWEAAGAGGSRAAQPGLRGPLLGLCPAGQGVSGGGREGRGRCALGEHDAQLGTMRRPLPKPAETPGACLAHCGGGSTPPASISPPKHPLWGSLKSRMWFSPPQHAAAGTPLCDPRGQAGAWVPARASGSHPRSRL